MSSGWETSHAYFLPLGHARPLTHLQTETPILGIGSISLASLELVLTIYIE